MDPIFAPESPRDGVRPGQQFLPAFFGAVISSLVGAFVWMFVPSWTGLDVGYVVIGMAGLVGLTVRYTGSGAGAVFGLVGVIFTLAGSLLGEILASIQLSIDEQNDFWSVVRHLNMSELFSSLAAHTAPEIYAIYVVALIGAYFLSIRKL